MIAMLIIQVITRNEANPGISAWSVDAIRVMLNCDSNIFLSSDGWIGARLAEMMYPQHKLVFYKNQKASLAHTNLVCIHAPRVAIMDTNNTFPLETQTLCSTKTCTKQY